MWQPLIGNFVLAIFINTWKEVLGLSSSVDLFFLCCSDVCSAIAAVLQGIVAFLHFENIVMTIEVILNFIDSMYIVS